MRDNDIIENILNTTDETKSSLARKLNVTRQFIGQVTKGERNLSSVLRYKLEEFYPAYFETVSVPDTLTRESIIKYREARGFSPLVFAKLINVSPSLQYKIENGDSEISDLYISRFKSSLCDLTSNMISISYDAKSLLNSTFIPTQIKQIISTVKIDKKLISNSKANTLRIITVDTDSMTPYFFKGDRVIFDESYNTFKDDDIYVFRVNNKTYVRKVTVTPKKIKCVAFNSDYDTFDIIAIECEVYGKLLKTRF